MPGSSTYTPASTPASTKVMPFEPIAIVGVGMRAPGGINDLASLWDTIIHQKSHHSLLATDPRFLRRFNPKDFEAMFSVTTDARTTLHGNLLDETPGLDEAYFGVSKRDSAGMDVQMKLLLHVAHEALEDAGFTGQSDGSAFDPATFGVFVGMATDDFSKASKYYRTIACFMPTVSPTGPK
jgi:acyl transferase domain-containing protein